MSARAKKSVIQLGHSRLSFPPRATQYPPHIVDSCAIGDHREYLNIFVAFLLASVIAGNREAGFLLALAALVDDPDRPSTRLRTLFMSDLPRQLPIRTVEGELMGGFQIAGSAISTNGTFEGTVLG